MRQDRHLLNRGRLGCLRLAHRIQSLEVPLPGVKLVQSALQCPGKSLIQDLQVIQALGGAVYAILDDRKLLHCSASVYIALGQKSKWELEVAGVSSTFLRLPSVFQKIAGAELVMDGFTLRAAAMSSRL